MKLALIKFLVGGLAVTLSYIISVILPWKELGGVFATLPAVFLVSLFITECNMAMSLLSTLVEVQCLA